MATPPPPCILFMTLPAELRQSIFGHLIETIVTHMLNDDVSPSLLMISTPWHPDASSSPTGMRTLVEQLNSLVRISKRSAQDVHSVAAQLVRKNKRRRDNGRRLQDDFYAMQSTEWSEGGAVDDKSLGRETKAKDCMELTLRELSDELETLEDLVDGSAHACRIAGKRVSAP